MSDGIFAVAMTLLVLDMKLPATSANLNAEEFTRTVVDLWPKVGAFFLSFLVLARAWELHRYVFDYLIRHDHALIYLNMAYLLGITLLPFSTALVGEHPQYKISAVIYSMNFLAIAGMKFIIWSYATHKHKLVSDNLSLSLIRWLKKRLLVSSFVILIAILLAFMSPKASILLLLGYQLTMIIIPFFRTSLES